MEIQKLYLQTIFCCIACDGYIVPQEIKLLKDLINKEYVFEGIDCSAEINHYVEQINKRGKEFLTEYIRDLKQTPISPKDIYCILDLAFKSIEVDEIVEYAEIKFVKTIIASLNLSREDFLTHFPNKEDFLMSDIIEDDYMWEDVQFEKLVL